MHRYIMNAQPGQVIDHINGDKLDNRRENLRFVTTSQNNHLRRGCKKMRGVWITPKGKYKAYIKKKGRFTHIGIYDTPEEAVANHNLEAKKLYGDLAVLSEVDYANFQTRS